MTIQDSDNHVKVICSSDNHVKVICTYSSSIDCQKTLSKNVKFEKESLEPLLEGLLSVRNEMNEYLTDLLAADHSSATTMEEPTVSDQEDL